MNLQVLVSTYKSRLKNNSILIDQLKKVDHLIIDQVAEMDLKKEVELNVQALSCPGLTKSRNAALSFANGDICLISDDDLEYVDNFQQIIIESFKKYPNAVALTFQIKTPEGAFYKPYRSKSFLHTKRSVISTSSVEIAVKRSFLAANNIKFDEEFGVNAKFPAGEEAILLSDCMNHGGEVRFVPEVICIHPSESSGKNYDGKNYLLAKGALIKRLYGVFGFFMLFAFMLKNLKKILNSNAKISQLFSGYFTA